MAHPPASKTVEKKGQGLPASIRSDSSAPAETRAEGQKRAHDESEADFNEKRAELLAADKFGEVMENAPFASFQCPTQIWGVKAAAEKQYVFSRWYFMAKDNVIVDLFLTQELYDASDVEARRSVARKYGTRYAALGPKHSRFPLPVPKNEKPADKAERLAHPSLLEQIAQKVA